MDRRKAGQLEVAMGGTELVPAVQPLVESNETFSEAPPESSSSPDPNDPQSGGGLCYLPLAIRFPTKWL
jgi:hypothetical protein